MRNGSSAGKVESNRRNALKSAGPKDTTRARFNATKHGLLAAGISDFDDAAGYAVSLERLTEQYKPVGELEEFHVERIALAIARMRRAGRLEAEHINAILHPVKRGPGLATDESEIWNGQVIDPGKPATIDAIAAQPLIAIFQRYETSIENKLYRAMNQLERLQRMREGERLPAPATLDVAVHSETEPTNS